MYNGATSVFNVNFRWHTTLQTAHVTINDDVNEAKIEESEKASSRQESNPGHLWLELPVLCN